MTQTSVPGGDDLVVIEHRDDIAVVTALTWEPM